MFEYLVLFQLKAGCQPEQAVAALEALWGLQIRLPGCMCAFGGPVLQDGAFLHGTGQQRSSALCIFIVVYLHISE